MIAVRLSGGLGNQLFQYAAGRALARRLSSELVLDVSGFGRLRPGETPRQYALGWMNVGGQPRQDSGLGVAGRFRRVPALAKVLTPWRLFAERVLTFDASLLSQRDGTLLMGYWQSYRYFGDIAQVIARDMEPALPLSQASLELQRHMAAGQSVAVHVRRGDYVSLANAAALHGVLPLGYYERALAAVASHAPAATLFVFSDDPSWCRANLPWPRDRMVVVDHNQGDNAWQDLVLMGHCHHHVIANSSFSWWGAWLADQRHGTQRRVVAPARWFAGQSHDTQDRLPPHWQRVDAA